MVGMPGVGKTFYGKYAAQILGTDFIDLDSE
ncbi:MAG: shikimate kinase, partial [Bacteroidia bacterium]